MIKALARKLFPRDIVIDDLMQDPDFDSMSVKEILSITPPGDFFRRMIAMAYRSPICNWANDSKGRYHSRTHSYEAGLTIHRAELLSMQDLPADTRRYIDKHVRAVA